MKKLTYEFVKEQFEKEGYTLLSEGYAGAETKLSFVCPNNHSSLISWQKWSQGGRCKYCNKSVYIEDVRVALAKEGYTLLSKDFMSTKQKLNFRCNNGHEHSILWSNWVKGRRCKECYLDKLQTKFSHIKHEIEKEGYTTLSDEFFYKQTSKIKVICDKNHAGYFTTVNKWRSGYRCKTCAYGKLSRLYKHKFHYIKNNIEKEKYTLISNEYKNAFHKLKLKCPLGHTYSVKWNDWQQGCRCRKCANINNSVRFSGSGSWNWQGGLSYEPYCPIWQDKEYKEDIKARDGYKCVNPHCGKENRRLVIHHIDYNKKNCEPKNLVTICNSCNVKANYDRDWHIAWYQAILSKRYNYKY